MNDTIYNYDRITGEYIGSSKAPIDIIETEKAGKDVYVKPSYSTFTEPPKTEKNEVSIFLEDLWIIKKDFRGSIYYDNIGTKYVIEQINDTLPNWAVLTSPPPEFINPFYDGEKWIDNKPQTILKYMGHEVFNALSVDLVTTQLLNGLNEDKVKTLKMLSGDTPCPEWDKFIEERKKLLDNGTYFKKKYFPPKEEGGN